MQQISKPAQIRVEVLAGLTVSLALVPEAVAFAFVAGVGPLVGLYAAFIVGLVTSGRLPEQRVHEAAERVLRLRQRLT